MDQGVVTVTVAGDEVVAFLLAHGARRSDVAPDLATGGRPAAVESHCRKIESGEWEETKIPIVYNEETGIVGPGADRVAALMRVDWAKAPHVPLFHIRVRHFGIKE